MPPAVILCGGFGTRIRGVTDLLPKPMIPIGGRPIVWHIMKQYASIGVTRFVLCLGYKREVFVDYFLNYRARSCDCTVTLNKENAVEFLENPGEEQWEVTLAGTGENSMTGCRAYRAGKYLKESEHFFLTYGDGVSDIDLMALYECHLSSGKMATVSAVRPPGRFGEMQSSENGVVTSFSEKPQTSEGLINGGFMVLRNDFLSNYLRDDEALKLEEEPLQRAAADSELNGVIHEGFWQCMDTAREFDLLNTMWKENHAPWRNGW